MINRIYCKNFKRIEECDIQLRDGITVLTGRNGTGKSSIVESVMFCLYGTTNGNKDTVRRSNTPDDELTLAIVDFQIDDKHYRCRRQMNVKNSVNASLYEYSKEEYQTLCKQSPSIPDKKTNGIGTERATGSNGVKAEISLLFGTDVDGFNASFVARQKKLDSFIDLRAENRKEFFLDLLGYKQLEKLKSNIGSKRNDIRSRVKALEGQSKPVDSVERECKRVKNELDKICSRIEKAKQKEQDTRAKKDIAEKSYNESRLISERVKGYEENKAKSMARGSELKLRIEELTASIDADAKASAGYDANTSIETKINEKRTQLDNAEKVSSKKADKERFEGRKLELTKKVDDLTKKIAGLTEMMKVKPDLEDAEKNNKTAINARSQSEQRISIMQKRYDELNALVTQVDNGEIAECPSCGSKISDASGKKHLHSELDEIANEIAGEKKNLDELVAKEIAAANRLADSQKYYRTFTRMTNDLDSCKRETADKRQQIAEIDVNIDDCKKFINENSKYFLSEQDKYNLQKELSELLKQLEREKEMRAAYQRLEKNRGIKSEYEKQIALERSEYAKFNALVKQNDEEVKTLPKKQSAYEESKKKHDDAYANLNGLLQEQSALTERLANCERDLEETKKDHIALENDRVRLETLEGCQEVVNSLRASLPSRIAPRLSEEASHVLDVATNGRYSMLELDESTYEVIVYTDGGRRPLSQMSGGESDVISLCIRIAIARILLESKGMTGQTFILDEIFGALDDERRASTCLALRNITKTMSKILCITHIEEIKDAADWMYVVETDENGVSHVREVIEENSMAAFRAREALENVSESIS